jgi:hypothetical protein
MYIYRIEFTLEQKFQKILKTNPKNGRKEHWVSITKRCKMLVLTHS